MKRHEYLADERVAGFTHWANHLITENLKLEHWWKNRRRPFCLYDPQEKYRWPELTVLRPESATDLLLNFAKLRYNPQLRGTA